MYKALTGNLKQNAVLIIKGFLKQYMEHYGA